MSACAIDLLSAWLARQLPEPSFRWLSEHLRRVEQGTLRDLEVLLGLAPRRLGRADIALSDADCEAAERCRPGWRPQMWTVDQAARVLALLHLARSGRDFGKSFKHLCRTADVLEAVALYRGLPLYPADEEIDWQVGEGLRTSMRAVFEAIAHHNSYPKEAFAEERWNHMVLKALFIGAALAPIDGLDDRANPTLAKILRDYAHERWAAGRPVSPELWRAMGRFAEAEILDDLARLTASGDARERRAAALALASSPDGRAKVLLLRIPEEAASVRSGRLSWETLSA
jgi:hypothetical protein